MTNDFKYRVFTDNQKLVDALKAKGNELKIGSGDPQLIEVIYTGGTRR
ncbi:MAG: hypothetical protein H0W76_12490 [Pyrinomonadaceae bacterium]|nr:hypothetical protein [Pyrinomonadaceae bacterium]